MNIIKTITSIAGAVALCSCSTADYPMTRKDNTVDVYFGHKVADPYRWLENDSSVETAEWVKTQNALTHNYLDNIHQRDAIAERLRELWHFERKSAPYKRGDYYFFSKNDGLQNQAVYYRSKSLEKNAEVEVVLDPNMLSDNGTVALSEFSVSPDGKLLGYGIARNGSDWNEYFVRDLATGVDLEDHLEWIKFSSIEWYKDGFFYSRYPKPTDGSVLTAENKDNAVYYHKIGTPQETDRLVFSDSEHNERSFGAAVTDDDKTLVLLVTESTTGNALYTLDLEDEKAKVARTIDAFDKDNLLVGNSGSRLFVMTNCDAANYRIVAIDPKRPRAEDWGTVIEENEDALESAVFKNGKFFLTYMHDAHSRAVVASEDGKEIVEAPLPGLGAISGFAPSKGETELYFAYSSYLSPSKTYRYDVETNQVSILDGWNKDFKGFDFDDYVTEQVFYPSVDGTEIPMFITHKKGVDLNGENPTWLYGYGGFNISMTPGFDVRRLLWLETGGVYAVANIRGGGEYGEKWHLAGTVMNKQNVFDDFISAARYLIDKKYTNPEKMVCQGGSNGGLLIGATINQAPELFRVAFPEVGVLDMLRYHKFTIGRYWATDYGTSDDSEEMFNYLLAYSPLHNVADRKYPSVMILTGDHDDRVVPAHSFKYAATMQSEYSGERPILIRIDSQAGHGAGKPVQKLIDEWADKYAFAFNELGMSHIY